MAIVISNAGNKVVADIATRNAIANKFDGMEVLVNDAIGDVMVGGSYAAGYKWSAAQDRWIMFYKDSKDNLEFIQDEIVISGSTATLTYVPQSGLIWDAYVLDTVNHVQVAMVNHPNITGNILTFDDTSFNGYTLVCSYGYGLVEAAVWAIEENYNNLLNIPSFATVATSGSYTDLVNKPSFSAVATTGSYASLTGAPSLATVATSGSYTDLSNTPIYSTVATSGSYNDLLNKPSIPTASSLGLATVATSGSYTDLTNKPNFATSSDVTSAIQAVVGAAPSALATLKAIDDQLSADETAAAALTTVVSSKAPINNPTFTGTVSGITAAMVGAATTAQVDALAPLASPTFTGTLTAANITDSGLTANTALVAGTGGALTSSSVTSTELGYVHGVTSAIQTQLNSLAPLASPTFTGTATVANMIDSGLTANTVVYANGSKQLTSSSVTTTELGYVSGVTSAIQTQLAAKAPLASPTFTGTVTAAAITDTGLTANTALIAGVGGALSSSSVTSTELGYVSGVTSAIQTQLGTKAPLASPTFTGTVNGAIATFTGAVTGSTFTDSIGNLRNIPLNAQASTYTLVASDEGKRVMAGNNVTIPSGVFVGGNVVLIYNNTAANITITCSAVTTYVDSVNTVRTSLTLATRGLMAINFNSATECTVSGKGLT